MNTKGKRLWMEIGVAATAVVILVAFVLLSQQPVTTKTPTNSPPGNGGGGGGGGGTSPPPPSTGGNNTTKPPVTPPTPPPIGNGKKVPAGWSHAACPKLDADIPAHGEKARCTEQATYGALKKAGLADAQSTDSGTSGTLASPPPTVPTGTEKSAHAPARPDTSLRSQ